MARRTKWKRRAHEKFILFRSYSMRPFQIYKNPNIRIDLARNQNLRKFGGSPYGRVGGRARPWILFLYVGESHFPPPTIQMRARIPLGALCIRGPLIWGHKNLRPRSHTLHPRVSEPVRLDSISRANSPHLAEDFVFAGGRGVKILSHARGRLSGRWGHVWDPFFKNKNVLKT